MPLKRGSSRSWPKFCAESTCARSTSLTSTSDPGNFRYFIRVELHPHPGEGKTAGPEVPEGFKHRISKPVVLNEVKNLSLTLFRARPPTDEANLPKEQASNFTKSVSSADSAPPKPGSTRDWRRVIRSGRFSDPERPLKALKPPASPPRRPPHCLPAWASTRPPRTSAQKFSPPPVGGSPPRTTHQCSRLHRRSRSREDRSYR